jgi:hypothetical protein
VQSRKVGSGRGSRWYWELSDDRAHRTFKDRDLEDLMDRLLYGGDGPQLPGEEWKRGLPPTDDGADDPGDGGGRRPPP